MWWSKWLFKNFKIFVKGSRENKKKSIFQLRATNRNRNDNQIQTQTVYYGQQHCLIDFKIYGIELNFFFSLANQECRKSSKI